MTMLRHTSFGQFDVGAHAWSVDGIIASDFQRADSSLTMTDKGSGSQGDRRYLTMAKGADAQMRAWTGTSTIVLGFRFQPSTVGVANVLCDFNDGGSYLGYLGVTAAGQLGYWKDAAHNIGSTPVFLSTINMVAAADQYIEVKIVFHQSAGSVQFKVGGVDAGTSGAKDTINIGSSCDFITWGIDTVWDEWHNNNQISDVAVNNSDFSGPSETYTAVADGDGAMNNWTPDVGNNWENVDEEGTDKDTTFNSSTATGTKDRYAHSAVITQTPIAVQTFAHMRLVEPGTANGQVGMLSVATEVFGAVTPLYGVYRTVEGPMRETDPDGDVTWTIGAVNALKSSVLHAA